MLLHGLLNATKWECSHSLLCRTTTQHTSRNPMTRLNLSTYYVFNVKDSELEIARVMGMTTIHFTWPIN